MTAKKLDEMLIQTPNGKKRWGFVRRAIENHDDLKTILQRLAEKVRRANEIQHRGGRVNAEDWSELHQLTNEAFGVLANACQNERTT